MEGKGSHNEINVAEKSGSVAEISDWRHLWMNWHSLITQLPFLILKSNSLRISTKSISKACANL
jgi:hypothetical protein